MNSYKGHITELEENEVFVFGSNGSGFHGAGSAGFASFGKPGNIWRKEGYANKPDGWVGHWNVKGIARGFQEGSNGSSYAIQTVTKPGDLKSISPEEMKAQIRKLYFFCYVNKSKKFYIAQENRIGYNGWEPSVMAECYKCLPPPPNVYFEEGFFEVLKRTKVYYAGIGSRSLPEYLLEDIKEIASRLEDRNFILRSGNATGSDQAFQNGVKEKGDIYLPWDRFEEEYQKSNTGLNYITVDKRDVEAEESVNKFHPNGPNLKVGARSMMRRNYRQVVGRGEPDSSLILCWTENAEEKGGTAQAIRIAKDKNIPILNFGNKNHLRFVKFLVDL